MTTEAPPALPFASNDEWSWRWLYWSGVRGGALHRIVFVDHKESYDWVGVIGRSACGRQGQFNMPGFMGRLGAPRCKRCAGAVGVNPEAWGAPYNSGEQGEAK